MVWPGEPHHGDGECRGGVVTGRIVAAARAATRKVANGPHVWREAHGGTRSGGESSGTA
jgi:hypothetical protein